MNRSRRRALLVAGVFVAILAGALGEIVRRHPLVGSQFLALLPVRFDDKYTCDGRITWDGALCKELAYSDTAYFFCLTPPFGVYYQLVVGRNAVLVVEIRGRDMVTRDAGNHMPCTSLTWGAEPCSIRDAGARGGHYAAITALAPWEMSCIRHKGVDYLDGTWIEAHIVVGQRENYFRFRAGGYNDRRYNRIQRVLFDILSDCGVSLAPPQSSNRR